MLAYIYVNMGIRDAHFRGCLFSLDTGRAVELMNIGRNLVVASKSGPVETVPTVPVATPLRQTSYGFSVSVLAQFTGQERKDVRTKKKRKRRKKAPKVTEPGASSPTVASPAPASISSPVVSKVWRVNAF